MLKKHLPFICGLLRILSFGPLFALMAATYAWPEARDKIGIPTFEVIIAFFTPRFIGGTGGGWDDGLPHFYSTMFAAMVLGMVILSIMHLFGDVGIAVAVIMIPSLPEFVRMVLVETAFKNGWEEARSRWCGLF